ncbi:hypothetical protein AVEN_105420-1 [Araneus ventricosus]|uniref:Uncharacterized protein n=1 Tax=Araneus ventricosus TaxID=182803 RepID=A0A4Y2IEY7_ARAVE|nr:hypothetical protein AVEN_105420-1 [Araneus ventricosus]
MPDPGEESVLESKQRKLSQPLPYAVYGEFEAVVEQLQNIPDKIASLNPCCNADQIIGPNGLPQKPVVVYRGVDAVDDFIRSIVKEKDILAAKLHTIIPMHMTTRDLEEFQKGTH